MKKKNFDRGEPPMLCHVRLAIERLAEEHNKSLVVENLDCLDEKAFIPDVLKHFQIADDANNRIALLMHEIKASRDAATLTAEHSALLFAKIDALQTQFEKSFNRCVGQLQQITKMTLERGR